MANLSILDHKAWLIKADDTKLALSNLNTLLWDLFN